jgi:hypothetical protein
MAEQYTRGAAELETVAGLHAARELQLGIDACGGLRALGVARPSLGVRLGWSLSA